MWASYPINSLTAVLLVLALASRTLHPNPLLPLRVRPCRLPPRLPLPGVFPTSSHSRCVSSSHLLHSLTGCSRLYLPRWHYQHWPPPLLLEKEGYHRAPAHSWEKRLAMALGTAWRRGPILGLNLGPVRQRSLPPVSGRHVLFPAARLLKKEALILSAARRLSLSGTFRSAASLAYRLTASFTAITRW